MRHPICASGIALSLAFSGPAAAQPRDPAAAEALFKSGREAMARGDYATACPRFEQSQKLYPTDGTLFNLAECEEHQGHFLVAARRWREGAEFLPPEDPKRPLVLDKAMAAERRAAKVVLRLVSSAPPGTLVQLDGAQVAGAGLGVPLPVDPGEHVVLVRATGRVDQSLPLHLDEGQQQELQIAPGPELPPVAAPPPTMAPAVKSAPVVGDRNKAPEPKPRSFLEQHRLSLIGGGVAAGLAGAGLGLGIRTLSHHSEFVNACNSGDQAACLSNRDAVAREASVANILFGVAGAAAVGSAVVFFTVEREKSAPSVAIAPSFGGMTILVRY
jgi:hypothetical protein